MTVYSKRAIALPNPNGIDKEDAEIHFPYMGFNHNVPDGLKKHPYFQANVKDGNLIVMDKTEKVEKVLEKTEPKRANEKKELTPESVNIVGAVAAKASDKASNKTSVKK